MNITVYGSGCVMCGGMGESIRKAVEDLEIEDIKVEKVCDPEKIAEVGITETPALALNGKVVLSGKIPEPEEIKKLMQDNI
ncbi:MAG: thioredoxin family protein [Patescibacteria group bacterium]